MSDPAFAASSEGRERDLLDLTWKECSRRFLRKSSRAGRNVGILLPVSSQLRQGDVIYRDAALLIQVEVAPTDVCVIPIRTVDTAATIAYELGNLHCPVQVTAGEIIIVSDEAMQAILIRRGIEFHHQKRLFEPREMLPELAPHLAADFQVIRSSR